VASIAFSDHFTGGAFFLLPAALFSFTGGAFIINAQSGYSA